MSELIEKLAEAMAVQHDKRTGTSAAETAYRAGVGPCVSYWNGEARAVLSTLADNLTPEMVEAGLQAQCDLPGCEWTDAVSDGLAMVMRLKMEKALTAALRKATEQPQ